MSAATQEPLEKRLVQEALQIIDEEGLDQLSLRRVARRVGVSHGAPLRHFRSLADLRAEVAGHGFRKLHAAVVASSEALPAGAGPLARLRAASRAYVEAAVENPDLFALMFRPDDLDRENRRYRREADAAFGEVLRHVRAAQDAGWRTDEETALLAGCVWSAVHGLATLWAQGAWSGPVPGATLGAALDLMLTLVLEDRHGGTS